MTNEREALPNCPFCEHDVNSVQMKRSVEYGTEIRCDVHTEWMSVADWNRRPSAPFSDASTEPELECHSAPGGAVFSGPVEEAELDALRKDRKSLNGMATLLATARRERDDARSKLAAAEQDGRRYRELATPEIHDFMLAVEREAAHQRDRWETEHDSGKSPEDWLWLVAYLSVKATQANRYGDQKKYLHHIVTCAAACCNWHANATGANKMMRPGVEKMMDPAALAPPPVPGDAGAESKGG